MSDSRDRQTNGDVQTIRPIAGGALAADAIDLRKRRRRLIILLSLSLLVLGVAVLDIYYLTTRKPLTELVPPAVAVAKTVPPAFVASFYGMSTPMGVAVSPDGQRVYVSELEGDRLVRAYDRTGVELYSIALGQGGAASRQPVYLAVDGRNQLHIVDRSRMAISVYNSEGRFVSDLALPAEAAISSPLGVSFDRAGNYLITDTGEEGHKVVVLDREGRFVRRIGKSGEGAGQLLFPNQAAADSRGRIYVTNGNLARVDIFGSDGGHMGPLAPGGGAKNMGLPRGIAVDHLDRLFAVDSVNCVVQVFDVSGDKPVYLYNLGGEGDGNGQLRYPTGIALDATGRVYVADRVNYRLQVWSY